MVDLLPCPFCGGTELSHGYSWPPEIGVVQCHSCDALVTADSEDEAITKWNRRAAPSAGLREALNAIARIDAALTLSKEGGSALTPRVSPKVSLYQTAKRLLDLAGRIERARTNAEENRLCDERDALLAKFRAADAKIEALHKEVADLKHDLARHIEIASDIATDADIRGEANPHDE